jgi:hypothetical protein
MTKGKVDFHEAVYDLECDLGWLLGSILVIIARPFMWLMFREWSDQRP